MQKENAVENLRLGKQILDTLGLPFWLSFGTSLGAYRDGTFCEGDEWDIDFSMHIDQYQHIEKIKDAFIRNGFTIRFDHQHPLGIAPEISFNRDGGHVDIFFMTPLDGKMAWVFYTTPPQVRIIDDFFKEFDKIVFFGMEFNIPHPIEEYLKANYGPNWRIPIPTKNWRWDLDNQCSILYRR